MLKKKTKTAVDVDMSFDLTAKKTKSKALVVEDDEPIVLAKKKKPKLPALTAEGKQRISKSGKLHSIMGDDAESLQQLLESGDSDSALSILNKRLIQTSIDLIAEVEAGIRESNGRFGVHSFNGLVQTIRELMIDLQSTQDRGAMGVTLMDTVIRPAMLEIAMAIMTEYATVANEIKLLVDADTYKEVRESQKASQTRAAALIQSQYGQIRDKTIEFLQR